MWPTRPGLSRSQSLTSAMTNITNNILDTIESYVSCQRSDMPMAWPGRSTFLPIVSEHVSKGNKIAMVLPAFPFKSPNRKDKVIGSLPDLGEVISLQFLEGICCTIAELYSPGAHVYIVSDGLVYNDILGVSDGEVWDYGEALRALAAESCPHISFVRLWDLLDQSPVADESSRRDHYLARADSIREDIIAQYSSVDFDVRKFVRADSDACATYCGYIKFLTKDLAYSHKYGNLQGKQLKKKAEEIARIMIGRGRAFAAAIADKFPNCVRLSIHPSNGERKAPLSLIPQKDGRFGRTPWHSCVAVGIDGSFSTVHAEDVRESHDLIYKNDRPYYYRERSPLYDLGEIDVQFEPLYPCGLLISTKTSADSPTSLLQVNMQNLKGLAQAQSPIVLRGFADCMSEEIFEARARDFGEVQPLGDIAAPLSSGNIQKVRNVSGSGSKETSVTTNEAMPMHYDGVFKLRPKKSANGEDIKEQSVPNFQLFTNVAAPPEDTGRTLFASSRLFFRNLPSTWTIEQLEKIQWSLTTPGFFESQQNHLPLVIRHPLTRKPCLRWHESWSRQKTKCSTYKIGIENGPPELEWSITSMLYDRRVCLRFRWQKGDFVVNDNVSMHHTRTAFLDGCDRELWRIHVN